MNETELAVTLRNDLREIARLTALLEDFCARQRLSEDDRLNVNLVLDEAVINVINHGYTDSREHDIVVRLALAGESLQIDIEDDGVAYNPLDAPAPRFDLPIEQRRIGGLGVHIMKTLARGIEYRRVDGRNHLTITMDVGEQRTGMGQA